MKSRIVQFQLMRLWLAAMVMMLALNATPLTQQVHPTKNPNLALEPTKILPKSYKLEFENGWVRIVRVHYDAKAKLPEHEHPAGATVYLYLNASDGVVFSHDDNSAPVPRPPVQPGGIRVAVTPLEHHTVVNNADTPSDFIRVLLKTEINQKIARPNARLSSDRIEFDHPSIRVARINVQPGAKTRVEAKNYPMLRIAAIPGKTEWRIAGNDGYRFLDKGTTEEFEVTGDVPMQLVTIELRSSVVK